MTVVQSSPYLNLPYDAHIGILSNLGAKDLCSMRLVCTDLRDIIDDDDPKNVIWKFMCINEGIQPNDSRFNGLLVRATKVGYQTLVCSLLNNEIPNSTTLRDALSHAVNSDQRRVIEKVLISNPENLLEHSDDHGVMLSGKKLSECHCGYQMNRSRSVHYVDVRQRAENIFLSAVRQFFPTKDTIRICAINQDGDFTELVIHALLTKIGKVANWFFVDRAVNDDFRHYAQLMSPASQVELIPIVSRDWSMPSELPPGIDAFTIIHGPSWAPIQGTIERYMLKSANPTFAMYADQCEELILTHCQGNNTPCIRLSHKPISKLDIRPSFILTPEINASLEPDGLVDAMAQLELRELH